MTAIAPLPSLLYVALGGAAGSVLRYQAGRAIAHWIGARAATAFPWATLTVNVVGSLAMGLLVGLLARQAQGGEVWRLLIGVGLLGGFTTFSSFSMEVVLLMERGAIVTAAFYALVSVLAGVAGMMMGLALMRAA